VGKQREKHNFFLQGLNTEKQSLSFLTYWK